jgi:hypothetical protein
VLSANRSISTIERISPAILIASPAHALGVLREEWEFRHMPTLPLCE